MTQETAKAPVVPVDSKIEQQENADARVTHGEDGNPDSQRSAELKAPDLQEKKEQERELSPREQIAKRFRESREAEPHHSQDQPRDDLGQFVPKAAQEQEEGAPAEADEGNDEGRQPEPAAKTEENKTYVLKVNGNELKVTRAQLLAAAEVDEDEADDFGDARLVRIAQKNTAASLMLDEARNAVKNAARKPVARTEDTTRDDTGQDDDDTKRSRGEHDPDDTLAAVEAIQFGDPEKAAEALDKLVTSKAQKLLGEHDAGKTIETVENDISKATRAFEQANPDLLEDEDNAAFFFNTFLVKEFKQDLVKGGVPAEKVNSTIPLHGPTALEAYTAVAASGKIKGLRSPVQLLEAAGEKMRAKLSIAKPTTTETPRSTPAVTDRVAAKRSLQPQPTRASAARGQPAPKDGQSPAQRSNIVQEMRKRRGQVIAY